MVAFFLNKFFSKTVYPCRVWKQAQKNLSNIATRQGQNKKQTL